MGGHLKKRKAKSKEPAAQPKKAEMAPSEIDFETLIRDEYSKLHRMYRMMENTSHAIVGASGKLSKQGHLLVHLKDQKDSLKVDLNNATCTTFQKRDKSSIKTILNLLETYETYNVENNKCITEMKEMESNMDRITKRLIEQKLKVQAIFGQAFTQVQVDRRIQVLENRLYYATTQFDTLVARNTFLKDEIDMMLKIRGQFFRRIVIIKKLSSRIKAKMGGIVFEATSTYEQRDDWVSKNAAFRERNDKDSRQHVLEIKEFQRVLHNDSKCHDFMVQKNHLRDLFESTQQRTIRKNQVKVDDLNGLLHVYRKSFKSILKMTIHRDVESLVTHYMAEEQKNYSIFKYITDLNNEVNWLKQSIDESKVLIEELNEQNSQTELNNDEELERLEAELMNEKSDFLGVSSEWKSMDFSMEGLGTMLDLAFAAAGCSSDYVTSLLGNSKGMRPSNICLCMSILERRITELLDLKNKFEVQKAVEVDFQPLPKRTQFWQPGVKPIPCGGPFKPKLVITFRVDTEQDDEDTAEAHRQDSKDLPIYYHQIRAFVRDQIREKRISIINDDDGIPAPSTMDVSGGFSNASLMDTVAPYPKEKNVIPVPDPNKPITGNPPPPTTPPSVTAVKRTPEVPIPPASPLKATSPREGTTSKPEGKTQPQPQPESEIVSSDPQPRSTTPDQTQPPPANISTEPESAAPNPNQPPENSDVNDRPDPDPPV